MASVTSLTGNGVRDWLIQRASAVVIGVYAIYVGYFFYKHPHIQYQEWQTFMHCQWMQIASLITLLAIVLHSWIGLWTVATDYIKCYRMRITFLTLLAILLIGLFVWGTMIFWS